MDSKGDEIMTHEELDTLIAELVMGNKVKRTEGQLVEITNPTTTGMRINALSPYSTDMRAAWRVVEKLENAFDSGYESFISAETLKRTYRFEFCEKGTCNVVALEFNESLPTAICLAAHTAIEVLHEID